MDDLLENAPAFERSLLELRASWRALPDAHSRVAARLRVFVLNWDPLGWLRGPFEPRATATGDGDTFELVLYVALPDVLADGDLLGDLARSVLTVAVEQELLLTGGSYAQLVQAGKVADLLSAVGTLSAIEPPTFVAQKGGWEPIGLGAIQDLVQACFGPVDLDRAKVGFDPCPDPTPACPACAGRRFGFPAELADAQAAMCARHAEKAAAVIATRLQRAEASNPDGWRAIADASAALSQPTYGLPLALVARLGEATDRLPADDVAPDVLSADATAALELAKHLRGRPADFEEWVDSFMAHDWMTELPWDLARRGRVDDAVRVADAFVDLDPDRASLYANDAAVLLAEAGRGDEARVRVEANLRAYPRDLWTHVHAGDVHRALDDLEQAERAFRRAAAIAEAGGNRDDAATLAQRLSELLAMLPGRDDDATEAARAVERALTPGGRIAPRTGRNDPCPCGSGRKYKKCCGA